MYKITLKESITVSELIEVLKQVPGEFGVSIWCDIYGNFPRLEVKEESREVAIVGEL